MKMFFMQINSSKKNKFTTQF